MSSRQTDNSNLDTKLRHRIRLVESLRAEGKPVVVLDAYAGEGRIWHLVERETGALDGILSIEKERGKNKTALVGDNEKLLPGLDLSEYTVIDLDAYGMPFAQTKAILGNPTLRPGTWVLFTFCYWPRGSHMNPELFKDALGLTLPPGFAKYLVAKILWPAYLSMLAKAKVESVTFRHFPGSIEKRYGYYKIPA